MFAFDCKLAPCFGIEDALIGSIVLMMKGMAQAVGYLIAIGRSLGMGVLYDVFGWWSVSMDILTDLMAIECLPAWFAAIRKRCRKCSGIRRPSESHWIVFYSKTTAFCYNASFNIFAFRLGESGE